MKLQPMEFVQAFLVALLERLYLAWRMGQTQLAEALRAG